MSTSNRCATNPAGPRSSTGLLVRGGEQDDVTGRGTPLRSSTRRAATWTTPTPFASSALRPSTKPRSRNPANDGTHQRAPSAGTDSRDSTRGWIRPGAVLAAARGSKGVGNQGGYAHTLGVEDEAGEGFREPTAPSCAKRSREQFSRVWSVTCIGGSNSWQGELWFRSVPAESLSRSICPQVVHRPDRLPPSRFAPPESKPDQVEFCRSVTTRLGPSDVDADEARPHVGHDPFVVRVHEDLGQ